VDAVEKLAAVPAPYELAAAVRRQLTPRRQRGKRRDERIEDPEVRRARDIGAAREGESPPIRGNAGKTLDWPIEQRRRRRVRTVSEIDQCNGAVIGGRVVHVKQPAVAGPGSRRERIRARCQRFGRAAAVGELPLQVMAVAIERRKREPLAVGRPQRCRARSIQRRPSKVVSRKVVDPDISVRSVDDRYREPASIRGQPRILNEIDCKTSRSRKSVKMVGTSSKLAGV
jgi:hypothetical protein